MCFKKYQKCFNTMLRFNKSNSNNNNYNRVVNICTILQIILIMLIYNNIRMMLKIIGHKQIIVK